MEVPKEKNTTHMNTAFRDRVGNFQPVGGVQIWWMCLGGVKWVDGVSGG